MRYALGRARTAPPAALVIAAALAAVSADVFRGGGSSKTPAIFLLGILAAMGLVRIATNWRILVAGMLLVVILVPSDGRYTLAGGLPIQLEPYRVVAGFMIIGWLIAMLVDPRVRARSTKLEGPVMLIILATVGSVFVNPGRVETVTTYVIKSMSLFACFMLLLYLMV